MNTYLFVCYLVARLALSGIADPPDGAVTNASQEVVPLVFPVMGPLTERLIDSFGDPRSGGRQHHGQDLMARKMTPLVAVFDGTVYFSRTDAINAHNMLTLSGDNGLVARYLHINNDTPGSENDGKGSREYAFAPNLRSGMHVVAGQFLGWVGNSGNAESVGPHLHFELERAGVLINAFRSLKQAQHITVPRYSIPAPTVSPQKGEVRMDAVVREIDPSRSVASVWVVAYENAQGKQTVVTEPTQKWLQCDSGAAIVRRDDTQTPLRFGDLKPGDELTVMLPEKVETATLTPRRLLVDPAPALVAARKTLRRPPPTTEATPPSPDDRQGLRRDDLPLATRAADVPTRRPDPMLAPPADLADRLTAHLNYYRELRNLKRLARETKLDDAAQGQAEALLQSGESGREAFLSAACERRARESGYRAVEMYVCLITQQATPEKAIEYAKLRREAQVGLFHPAVSEIGIGYAEGSPPGTGFRRYWVIVLASPSGKPAGNQPARDP